MRISDSVAKYIMQLLNEADGTAGNPTERIGQCLGMCSKSDQLRHNFPVYAGTGVSYVESRRGGGGYIRITRRQLSKSDVVMHIINAVGDSLDGGTARAMTENMLQNGVIDSEAASLLQAAASDKSLSLIPREFRDAVRASIYKNMLLVVKT